MAEAGMPGYVADFSLVMFAPKGTPEAMVKRMRDTFAEALTAPENR